jgi:hypothetical protein
VSARRALGPAAVALAVAVGATAALTSGGREVRFTPCPNGAAAACATLPGDGPPVRIALRGPGPGPPSGVPDRLVAVLGGVPLGGAEVGVPLLVPDPPSGVARALDVLSRRAVVAAGPDAGAVRAALAAGRAPGGPVTGLVLFDPPPAPPAPPPGADRPPPPVMLVLPGPRPGVAASYEPWADRVVVLRTGAVRTPPECARIALTGFARDPLGERPTVTDCR